MSFSLNTPAFDRQQPIPAKYTGDDADRSPRLGWTGVPQGTKFFALVCDDPDAPVGIWDHWVIYDIPASVTELPEGVQREPVLRNGAKQGKNSWGEIGYRGPMPPKGHGKHRYYFTLYALARQSGLGPGASKQALIAAIRDKVLAKAQLMGTYSR